MNKEEIEKLIKDYAEMHEKLQKVIKQFEEKESKEWKPKHCERYWFVDVDFEAEWYTFDENDDRQNYLIKHNKIFEDGLEAEEYANYLKAIAERTYKFSKEEWEDKNIEKWFIKYITDSKRFKADIRETVFHFNKFTFKTYEEAQAFIDEYGSMILKYEF